MTVEYPAVVDTDAPSDLRIGSETWRLHWYGKMIEPSGRHALATVHLQVIEGAAPAADRPLVADAFVLATAIAGMISQHACCDRHAQELARQIGDEIVKHTVLGRQWREQRAGKPN